MIRKEVLRCEGMKIKKLSRVKWSEMKGVELVAVVRVETTARDVLLATQSKLHRSTGATGYGRFGFTMHVGLTSHDCKRIVVYKIVFKKCFNKVFFVQSMKDRDLFHQLFCPNANDE